MNHTEKMIRQANQIAEQLGVSVSELKSSSSDLKICEFHARLSEASVLYGPMFQAELFNMAEKKIHARITSFYERNRESARNRSRHNSQLKKLWL